MNLLHKSIFCNFILFIIQFQMILVTAKDRGDRRMVKETRKLRKEINANAAEEYPGYFRRVYRSLKPWGNKNKYDTDYHEAQFQQTSGSPKYSYKDEEGFAIPEPYDQIQTNSVPSSQQFSGYGQYAGQVQQQAWSQPQQQTWNPPPSQFHDQSQYQEAGYGYTGQPQHQEAGYGYTGQPQQQTMNPQPSQFHGQPQSQPPGYGQYAGQPQPPQSPGWVQSQFQNQPQPQFPGYGHAGQPQTPQSPNWMQPQPHNWMQGTGNHQPGWNGNPSQRAYYQPQQQPTSPQTINKYKFVQELQDQSTPLNWKQQGWRTIKRVF